ncbi:family 16 glycosylhydrolase [Rariglobus hedericola]|nr:family 16 glycosylhydrolase [Rariglobus hedericola]
MALSALGSLLVSAPRAHAAPPPGYTLVWSDEFDGSTLDPQYWNHTYPGNYRDAFNTSDATTVAGGNLTITTYTEGGVHYTDHLDTKNKYQPKYGYMEARILFSNAPGNWSAFWMFASTVGAAGDPRLAGVELDIVEHRDSDWVGTDISGKVNSTLHWDGYGANHKSVTGGLQGTGLGGSFHLYAMEWTPTYQKFFVDGVNTFTVYNSAATNPTPPEAPISQRSQFFMLSSEVLNNNWAGVIPAGGFGSKATSDSQMIVDYVRVYQTAPVTPAVPSGLAVANVNHRAITLSWNMVDNAPYYNVKRSLTSGGPYTTIATTGKGYTDTDVIPDTTYYYVVSAVNGPSQSANTAQVSAAPLPGDTHNGLWSAQMAVSGTASYYAIRQTVSVTGNTAYSAGIWAKGTGRIRFGVRQLDGTFLASQFITAGTAWTYYPATFNSGANTQVTYYIDDSSTTAGTVLIDDGFLGLSGGTNLLANPGFESGNTGWTIYQPTGWKILHAANVHSGTGSSRGIFSGTASYGNVRQLVNVTASTAYQAGFWIKGAGRVRFMIRQGASGSALASQFITATPAWTYYTVPFNSGANTQVTFYVDDSSGTAGTAYIDDGFLGVSGGANLLANPGFETGANGWSVSSSVWKPDQY